MRLPKLSLKRCFLLTLFFAVLVLFGFNFKENEPAKVDVDTYNWIREQRLDDGLAGVGVGAGVGVNVIDAAAAVPAAVGGATTQPVPAHQSVAIRQLMVTESNGGGHSSGGSVITASHKRSGRLWFFANGVAYPHSEEDIKNRKQHTNTYSLFPDEDSNSDRIVNQLMYVPKNYKHLLRNDIHKKILLYNGLGPWNMKAGSEVFANAKCPVQTCTITGDREQATTADLLIFKDHYIPPGVVRHPNQIYLLYFLESPYHSEYIKQRDAINWTSTYRKESDIVAPYEKWVLYDANVKQIEQERNYAMNKTKKVAWFVSNCGARNNRLQYAHELQKHISLDIYGACGSYKCPRNNADRCFEILDQDYKFYLAFENSNCRDYITEKFFVNSLSRNILPIVMGAPPEDYESSAPYKSYIHVDEFASPRELAEYLHILDKNDDLYNSYFKWKGTGEFINTYFWCRVCAMIHDAAEPTQPRWYHDINDWWRGAGVCTNKSWRDYRARKDTISDD